MRRLRGGDVDAISEWRDHEAARASEVLERVAEERVADVQDGVKRLALVERRVLTAVAHVLLPARLELAEPLEVVDAVDAHVDELDVDVARVGLEGDHVHRGAAVELLELALHHGDHAGEHHELERVVRLERVRVGALHQMCERRISAQRPLLLRRHERELRDVVVADPRRAVVAVLAGGVVVVDGSAELSAHLAAHLIDELVEVVLHLAVEREDALVVHLAHLALVGGERDDGALRARCPLELHARDALTDGVDVLHHDPRPIAVGQDVEEHDLRGEVEAREDGALRVKEVGEGLLAQLEVGRDALESLQQPVLGAAHDAIRVRLEVH